MKFEIGDKARVCYNAGVRDDFLNHVFKIGTEVEIAGFFSGWKEHEAYSVKINGRVSTEYLLAEELELIIKTKNMNIIEAFQQAEGGRLIRNGMLARIDHFLKYMGNGIFYEYKLSGQGLSVKKEYKYEIRDFSMAYILSNDWEVFETDLF